MVFVPYLLYILPIMALVFALKYLNKIIKKGKSYRLIALLLCLIVSCIWILGGYLLFSVITILPIIVMVTGALFLIIGCFNIFFVSSEKIIQHEIEEQIAEKKYEEEMKKYESYDWICQESRNILDSGKIEDYSKYSKLIEVLDNNRKYDEFKTLSKQLKALKEKIDEEFNERVRQARQNPFS